MENFTVGSYSQASHLSFADTAAGDASIFAGLSPYFAFDVLYDPAKGMVGLKPRPIAPGAPEGLLPNATSSK
jgi:hypothetical protein